MRNRTRLHFSAKLPTANKFGPDAILVYDRRLIQIDPSLRTWISEFPAKYPVAAGESLKSLRSFPLHAEKLLELSINFSRSEATIVALGGGTVGDFAGFAAAVLRRGLRLCHIPSTWLAALDSSHGGKTALNALGGKNQLGTFYPATDVYLCRKLLLSQPTARALEGLGELAKIALLDGGSWVRRIQRAQQDPVRCLSECLPDAIAAKQKIVARDPRELLGIRTRLNLGHTLGHVLEVESEMAHGTAVAQGTFFALDWSLERKLLTKAAHSEMNFFLERSLGLRRMTGYKIYRALPISRARRALRRDKKKDGDRCLTFIFLRGLGKPDCQSVSEEELLLAATKLGWIQA